MPDGFQTEFIFSSSLVDPKLAANPASVLGAPGHSRNIYIIYIIHYFNQIRAKNPAVYKKDKLSINSADVQKIRNTTCQKEAESRGSKETINTKKIKISKLLDFQIFYLHGGFHPPFDSSENLHVEYSICYH